MEYIVQTKSLTKKYGSKMAVNEVSINIKKGDIYGLIGKNGAGKTTLMKMLLGLTRPTSGEIRLFESSDLGAARKQIGSLIEAPALYNNQTATENMRRFALLSHSTESEIQSLLTLVGLQDVGRKKVGKFSLGMRQRLGIAIALLGNPRLLILDEPVNGLDPAGIKDMRDIILELNSKGITFVISSHLLDELGKIATTYGILSNGVLTEEISAEALNERCNAALNITVDDISAAISVLTSQFEGIKIESCGNQIKITSEIEDASAINEALVKGGVRVYELRFVGIGAEDFFIERMGN